MLLCVFCLILFDCSNKKSNTSDTSVIKVEKVFIRDTVYLEKKSSTLDEDYLPGNKNYKPLVNKRFLLEDFNVIEGFLWITDIYVSPLVFYDDNADVYDENYSIGYKYRLIITLSEIYTSAYIDKLILGMEGHIEKQEWSKDINWFEICDKFNLSYETSNIKTVKWINSSSFSFQVTNSKSLFVGIIKEKDNKVELEVQLLKK